MLRMHQHRTENPGSFFRPSLSSAPLSAGETLPLSIGDLFVGTKDGREVPHAERDDVDVALLRHRRLPVGAKPGGSAHDGPDQRLDA